MVTTDYGVLFIITLLYISYRRMRMTPNESNAKKWDMLNRLINTVRQFAGVPLRENNNPYKSKKRQEKSK